MVKKVLFFSMLLWAACGMVIGQTDAGTDVEKKQAAVKQTALDYIEGWFSGDPDRMARALHPALHKVGVREFMPNGKKALTPIGYTAMVELTRIGAGKDTPPDKADIQVHILDISGLIASVKVTSVKFTDYLLMAELDGQWKIINVLWMPPAK